jgi:hypothetical protein
VQLISLVANPPGADAGKESVVVQLTWWTALSWLTLLNKWSRYALFSGKQITSDHYRFVGTFNLPNRLWCVSLEQDGLLKESPYCYIVDDDGHGEQESERMPLLSDDALRVLNTITLKETTAQTCLSYKGTSLRCLPRTSKKAEVSHDKFYKTYITSLHDYLYYAWPTLYYHTDIRQYMKAYRDLSKEVKKDNLPLQRNGREYHTYDFGQIMDEVHVDSYYDRMLQWLHSLTVSSTTSHPAHPP